MLERMLGVRRGGAGAGAPKPPVTTSDDIARIIFNHA
jgi:hypothetical protein